MPKTAAIVPGEQHFILLSLPPSGAQKRLAFALVFGILAIYFIAVGPLSDIPPYPIAAFIPSYTTAMFVTEALTAILLFAQFSILRGRAILVIASGYLFTAVILIPWIAEYGVALRLLARWLSHVRNRLCLA